MFRSDSSLTAFCHMCRKAVGEALPVHVVVCLCNETGIFLLNGAQKVQKSLKMPPLSEKSSIFLLNGASDVFPSAGRANAPYVTERNQGSFQEK